jgi:hypothetical protein
MLRIGNFRLVLLMELFLGPLPLHANNRAMIRTAIAPVWTCSSEWLAACRLISFSQLSMKPASVPRPVEDCFSLFDLLIGIRLPASSIPLLFPFSIRKRIKFNRPASELVIKSPISASGFVQRFLSRASAPSTAKRSFWRETPGRNLHPMTQTLTRKRGSQWTKRN